MPPRAAKFAVGDRLQADVFLFPDDAFDLAVFQSLQVRSGDFAFGALRTRILQHRRPQQAPDVIGAERRSGALHGCPPYLAGDLDDHAQLRPLLILGQRVAFFRAGEAALRRERELIERREFRGLVDAAQNRIPRFKLAGLRRDQPEYDRLAFRQEAQRLEAARALRVVLHEVAVHVDRVEQDFGDRLVAAAGDEIRAEIPAAQMHRDRHVGRDTRDRGIDHARIGERQRVGIVAAGAHMLAQRRIAQIGEVHFVELQVAAARVRKAAHDLGIERAEVAVEIRHVGVNRLRHGSAALTEMQRGRGGDRHLRGLPRVVGDEFPVRDLRMRRE